MTNKIAYIPQIDGLRAIAVLSVILFHANFNFYNINFKGGYVGVDIFFVISGYLITKLILIEQNKGEFTFSNFFLRRIRRIMPALLTVAAVTYPFAILFFLPLPLLEYVGSLISGIFFTSNFFFYFNEINYYASPSIYKPLLHYWSLSVEEQFYFIYPLSLILIYKFSKRKIVFAFSIVAILSFIYSIYLSFYDQSLSFYMFPTRIWEFLIGALAAKMHLQNFNLKSKSIKFFLQIIGIIFIFSSIFFFKESLTTEYNLVNKVIFSHPGLITLIPVIGTFLIILFAQEKNFINFSLSLKPLVFIGLISYSLYLWHYPVFSFVKFSPYDMNTIKDYVILILSIFFLSFLSYNFIEQPFRKKKITSTKTLFLFLFIIIFTLFILCFHSYKNKGYSTIIPEYFKQFKITDKINNPLFKNTNIKPIEEKVNSIYSYKPNSETFLLIGDSHAGNFKNEIKNKLHTTNRNLIYLEYSNIFSLDFFNVERNNGDMKFLYKEVNNILENNNISTIILISRFPLYWHRTGFDNHQGTDGVEKVKFLPYFLDENQQRLEEKNRKKIIKKSFNKSLSKVLDKNINVIIFYPVPEAGFWVPNVVASRILPRLKMKSLFQNFLSTDEFFELPEKRYVTTSYDLFLDRNKEVFEMLDQIEHPNLYRIYPHKKLCDLNIKDKCITHSQNEIYYLDDDHLSDDGVKLIMPDFIEILSRIK